MRSGLACLILSCTWLSAASPTQAAEFSPTIVAAVLSGFDQKITGQPRVSTEAEMRLMVEKASAQCTNNLAPGQEPENIANMVMITQKKLADAGVVVSHYELLDVLYGVIGDGRKNWDCASALAMYLTSRTGDPIPARTHISAYKLVQSFRDSGLLGPRS